MATAISTHNVAASGGLSFVFREPLPGLVQLLSQGVTVGVLVYFGVAQVATFDIIPYYKLLMLSALPEYLGFGALLGSIGALTVWCATRLWKSVLPALARFPMAALGVSLGHGVWFLVNPPAKWESVYTGSFVWLLGITVLSIGFITGTRLNPARALGHGLWRINVHQPLLATFARLALAKVLVFGSLYSLTLLNLALQLEAETKQVLLCLLVLAYFVGSLAITLANPKLWIATIVGLIFNLPWIVLLTYLDRFGWGAYFIITMVSLWGAFILTRTQSLYSILSFFGAELRYYLID